MDKIEASNVGPLTKAHQAQTPRPIRPIKLAGAHFTPSSPSKPTRQIPKLRRRRRRRPPAAMGKSKEHVLSRFFSAAPKPDDPSPDPPPSPKLSTTIPFTPSKRPPIPLLQEALPRPLPPPPLPLQDTRAHPLRRRSRWRTNPAAAD